MFFLNMFKESFIVISSSVDNISLAVTNKAFLFYFEFPVTNFYIFCFFLIKKNSNYQTIIDHSSNESGKKLRYITEL